MTIVRCWEALDCEVWRVDLDQVLPKDVDGNLAAEELAKAVRFRFERDRQRYIRSHLILRSLLSNITGRRSGDIAIRHNSLGRPFLPDDDSIHFSLSRSMDVALIGISRYREIGVDVECVQAMPGVDAVVQEVCCSSEQEQWLGVAESCKATAFAICWTRKEAALKAVGSGLSIEPSLAHVGFSLAPSVTRLPTSNGTASIHIASFYVDRRTIGSIATVS